jgi:putative endonuclease
MEYIIYLLISEDENFTYIGFSDNVNRRIGEHKARKVKSTKNFGDFTYCMLEKVPNIKYARIQEKYWKSCTGRKKIKQLFKK